MTVGDLISKLQAMVARDRSVADLSVDAEGEEWTAPVKRVRVYRHPCNLRDRRVLVMRQGRPF